MGLRTQEESVVPSVCAHFERTLVLVLGAAVDSVAASLWWPLLCWLYVRRSGDPVAG